MKLSLRWIFDHLKADWKKCSIDTLVTKFNATTAEIEGVEKYSLDLTNFALGEVVSVNKTEISLRCPEWKKDIVLPYRDDAQTGLFFMLKKQGQKADWAKVSDWGGGKEKFLPAFSCSKKDLLGSWKKSVEVDDYIIEVDNKSITNRPDLWGHRGIARELSFLLKVPFLDEKQFLAKIPLKKAEKKYKKSSDMPISVSIDVKECNRFSLLALDDVSVSPSVLWMAARLCRIESSPIDLLVDASNYAMFDWGQPIHVFDRAFFKEKTISVRMAKKDESLLLLDGTKLELAPSDIVVTDGKRPVSLAGIKGGFESGVSNKTGSLLIESAHFDAETVRRTAARHKVRTDASARFEKTLDPQQNVQGSLRFVQLLKDENISMKPSKVLVSLGKEVKPLVVTLSHEFIEKRLGESLKASDIKKLLETIGFTVSSVGKQYKITIPTYRSSKDVTCPEDIVEEIGRLYGYQKIKPHLPFMQIEPAQEYIFKKISTIKEHLAFAAAMHEVQNYALFDGSFLQQLGWKIENGVTLKNPLANSSNTLVTSLIPHLLKNIQSNVANNDELRFFEWARIWSQTSKKEVNEQQVLSGVFFKKSGEVDFYEGKQQLENLFHALGLSVEWKKSTHKKQWAHPFQTADLFCGKTYLGTAGKVSLSLLKTVTLGDAFLFELDGDVLLEYSSQDPRFVELPKYQATTLDISVEVPLSVAVSELKEAIQKADERVFEVSLVDIFQKDTWFDKKSVTLRFSLRDAKKTLSKEDIENGYQAIESSLKKYGAHIR